MFKKKTPVFSIKFSVRTRGAFFALKQIFKRYYRDRLYPHGRRRNGFGVFIFRLERHDQRKLYTRRHDTLRSERRIRLRQRSEEKVHDRMFNRKRISQVETGLLFVGQRKAFNYQVRIMYGMYRLLFDSFSKEVVINNLRSSMYMHSCKTDVGCEKSSFLFIFTTVHENMTKTIFVSVRQTLLF